MKNFKTLFFIILVIGLIIIGFSISPKEDYSSENLLGISYDIEGNQSSLSYESENPIVAMRIQKYGSIVMELYPDIAPNTVNNFISLILKGFYDNNTFHRLMPGFVLQGGDPTGTGSGGPGYRIRGEFTNNGFENNLSHEKWVVSMARSNNSYDSAGSQFFICLGDPTYLDDNYATFGKVIDGFDTLEKIAKNEIIADTASGKLQTNLKLVKTIIDLKGKEYSEPEKMS